MRGGREARIVRGYLACLLACTARSFFRDFGPGRFVPSALSRFFVQDRWCNYEELQCFQSGNSYDSCDPLRDLHSPCDWSRNRCRIIVTRKAGHDAWRAESTETARSSGSVQDWQSALYRRHADAAESFKTNQGRRCRPVSQGCDSFLR